MPLVVRRAELKAVMPFRTRYRAEMNCQIVRDSIHARSGWTHEYVLTESGTPVGYGSVAVEGPWRRQPTLYEFYLKQSYRHRAFECFQSILDASGVTIVAAQTNDRSSMPMIHTFCRTVRAEAILFEYRPHEVQAVPGARVRPARPSDGEALGALNLHVEAHWVVELNGSLAGAGSIYYHYNPPYGDVFMEIAEPFRERGLGTYLVQKLIAACRRAGNLPAARCDLNNIASRKTLQRAGFVPCGNLVVGKIARGGKP